MAFEELLTYFGVLIIIVVASIGIGIITYDMIKTNKSNKN